jgi:hypothetical protein
MRTRKTALSYANLLKKNGKKQYKEIIKPDGGDWGFLEMELKEFNRKYGMALVTGVEEIDMRDCKNGFDKDLMLNLCSIRFPFCQKIWFPKRAIEINDFKPQMPILREIYANNCKIKQIELDKSFFPNLKRIDLENNLIENEFDIIGLQKLDELKLINIIGCPIEKTNEIFNIRRKWLEKGIEIRMNPQIQFPSYKDIEEESDSSIARGMMEFKDCYEEQSMPSKSNNNN